MNYFNVTILGFVQWVVQWNLRLNWDYRSWDQQNYLSAEVLYLVFCTF